MERFYRWAASVAVGLCSYQDRLATAGRLIAAATLAAALAIAPFLGVRTYHSGLQEEAEQRWARHHVNAVVVREATEADGQDEWAVLRTPPQGRWSAPDGQVRQGPLPISSARPGDVVGIWVDERGRRTEMPRERSATRIEALSTALALPLGVAVLLLLIRHLARRLVAHWTCVCVDVDREWARVEGDWNRAVGGDAVN